jgi:2-phosphosulfolactate phosphatase
VQDPWSQEGYDVRFDWGPTGAARVSERDGVLVIVDVLSFTTTVSVAIERGTEVYPAAWRDTRAADLAREVDAVLAVGRREVTAEHPWSLSPAALRAAPAPSRLVLPSPNGSAIAAAAAPGTIVAACLRNARAVAAWISGRGVAPVTVIAAGERWPDGSLRPALEDLLGAGAVISALVQSGGLASSPEATAARAVFEATSSAPDAVRRCGSGVELITTGYGADVDIAVELDGTDVVPVLENGAFRTV